MMARQEDQIKSSTSFQAGTGEEANVPLADGDMRELRDVGQQLAEIGDQLNQYYQRRALLLSPYRVAPYRGSVDRRLLPQTSPWLGIWASRARPSRRLVAGLLAVALVITAASWIKH